MNTLIVGDRFIAADAFKAAIEHELGAGFGPLRTVAWSADPEEQHGLQQVMERDGPEAVPSPTEIVAAAPGAELLVVHFAPVPAAVLRAADDLVAVVVARAGVENVNLAEASRRGVAVVNV